MRVKTCTVTPTPCECVSYGNCWLITWNEWGTRKGTQVWRPEEAPKSGRAGFRGCWQEVILSQRWRQPLSFCCSIRTRPPSWCQYLFWAWSSWLQAHLRRCQSLSASSAAASLVPIQTGHEGSAHLSDNPEPVSTLSFSFQTISYWGECSMWHRRGLNAK